MFAASLLRPSHRSVCLAVGLLSACSPDSESSGARSQEPNVGAAGYCVPDATGSVTFSVPSGTFSGELRLELRAAPGLEIRYTTDRSTPTTASRAYSTPLVLTATTQVRAQAFSAGVPAGPSSIALYVARSFERAHDMPIVVLDAYGRGALSRQDRRFVDVAFLAWDGNATSLAAAPQTVNHAAFHVRGQSSATFDKTPYRLEIRDAANEDLDCPVLGMPAESDWALHGPFPDKALIRNAFVYGLGRDLGLAVPRSAFAELYLNVQARPLAPADYMGVYLVVETIKNQRDRLNLQQLKPADTTSPAISGGYIFKFEWLAAEEPKLVCQGPAATCWSDLEVVDPSPLGAEQRAYLTQHIQAFHDALLSDAYADPTRGYPAYVDVPSFVNQVIVHELTRNLDAYVRSQYFHKDRNGKIVAGPLWDYDLTMNVGGAFDNLNVEGWQYEENAMRKASLWFQRMLSDPEFRKALVARWRQLRQGVLSQAQVDARIAALTSGLAGGAERNFQRWPNLAQQRIGPFTTPTATTWTEQVRVMRDWLALRMAWLDTQWR